MKTWIKRAGAVLLVAAGVVLLARHSLRLLDWKHLYPDLGQAGLGNLIFLALSLLTLAFAWIAAAYLVLNAGQRVLKLLIPAAAFILLMTLCGLCVTEAVGEVPCSYTSSLAACREELEPQSFRVRGKPLYPETLSGELTEYARYEKGAVLAETVTRSFDQDGFTAERENDLYRRRDCLRNILRNLKYLFFPRRIIVEVNGKKCRVLGHVGMVHAVVDVTDIECAVGDRVQAQVNPLIVKGLKIQYR
jgi:hypothetical protein